MSSEPVERVVDAVLASRRYRSVDRALVTRLATEELGRGRMPDDTVKRVKRRLHQAVGAFRGRRRDIEDPIAGLRATWRGSLVDPGFRDALRTELASHGSMRERVAQLETFFPSIWERTGGAPQSVVDLGCGLGPLALPWMGLASYARYTAVDVDGRVLQILDAFLTMVGQPHVVLERDLVAEDPGVSADVALLLKLVTTLDRQDRAAAARLINGLAVPHAVLSFPLHSLGGRAKGMERTYRARMEGLAEELGERVAAVAEASVSGELIFVLTLAPRDLAAAGG